MALDLPNAKAKITAVTEGTAQTLYTATANDQKVTSIRFANTDGTNSVNVSVFIENSAVKYYVSGLATPLPAGSAMNVVAGDAINLVNGDVVKVYASATGDADVIISFAELS